MILSIFGLISDFYKNELFGENIKRNLRKFKIEKFN